MGSADQANDGYSAVFFMDGSNVSRQMRASEFGAFLDGYVGLSDLADTDVKAVYVLLGKDLLVRSLVFFRIYFDEEGRADSNWNLPVEKLAKKGAKGPDMGAGPIRLVCRSQCPKSANAEELWDPDMTPGSNHFQAIRRALEANSLKLRKVEPAAEEDIPVLGEDARSAEDTEALNDRARLAQVIREQRLRIKTLQSVHRDALSDIQRENRHEMQALRNEMAELQQKFERQKLSSEQLKKRLAERNEQYLSMQEQIAGGDERKQREDATSDAEVVLLREQLERRQRELEIRDEKIVALEQENHDLRHQTPTENSVMEHLQNQSVFLVAYHPGVGHITLPYNDIETYFRNPVAYAAERCGLNEPAYKQWLEHYEKPVCHHQDDDGTPCDEPVMRVSQPADFRAGIDDRCEKHQPQAEN
ncbi:DNA repair protein [Marinobacter panjinensis]|uniref:DNA repair protein n=1 Tax=Marinobacter panjinensis TaxID=2576384 RepID=A0A4U6QUI3_9GAMM|nr:DNA repair protein [Marinobacter panjinensis]MCR8915166.1 DNA repair protein [Marinobacter panjinensis]TKV64391.1 DNA repair protein [Marinobacter panjinensis]